MRIPVTTLNDGYDFPLLGLGTYKLQGEECTNIVRRAIELGYRHIDTASFYGNEEQVGRAVADAIAAGDVTREELFITSKLWNDDQGRAAGAYEESLQRMGLEFIDLFLVHWPWPQHGTFVQAYESLVQLQGMGRLQSVGVANFYEEVLDEIIAHTGVVPVLNQVELHAGFTQPELRAYHQDKGIVTEAWAPLARGANLDDPVFSRLAEKHGRTPAQIALAYVMSLGCSVVPKTANPARLEENLGAVEVELSQDDIAALDALSGERMSNDPREFPGDSN